MNPDPPVRMFLCAVCGRAGQLDGEDLVPVISSVTYQSSTKSNKLVPAGKAICAHHWPTCRDVRAGDQVEQVVNDLRRRRRAARATVGELSHVIGISSSYLSELELGIRTAGIRTFVRWIIAVDNLNGKTRK